MSETKKRLIPVGEKLVDPAKVRLDPDVIVSTIAQIVTEEIAKLDRKIETQGETLADRLADLRRSLRVEIHENDTQMESCRDALSRENGLLQREIQALRAELDALRKQLAVVQRWSSK